ncbi:hypothetical protein [Ramlibacter sp. Leaf400]|uniref:hypothetical protein n=1 Tax=Ramlibacter sp. Leaf400 TaxID=1736365 RepID=UPI0012E330CD|nr:hypothetical protein [Ramlibacter sp. Leaf400]
MHSKKALMAALAALAAGPALACFTVYDRNNLVVYNALEAPVDMSRPLHETLPQKYPGGHLVFDNTADCPTAAPQRQMRVASTPGRSPLLMDIATAEKLGLKHTVIADGVAMVPDRPDNMQPGVVLAESGLPAAAGPDTRMMGAGPARPNTATQGPAARAGQRNSPVITEMHNPPLTAVQPGPYRAR